MNNQDEKQVGSNLTGAAIPGKPGHQRDIPIDQNIEVDHKEKQQDDRPSKHIENTDALLGDVHPTDRNETSQEEANAKKENGT